MDVHRHLDYELNVLRDRALLLGGEAEHALTRAMFAFTERNNEVAREVLNHELPWQYVFPAGNQSIDPRSGIRRRHHISEQALQRAIKQAVRDAAIAKPATPHPFPARW